MSEVKDEAELTPKEGEELSDEQLEGVAGGVNPPSGDLNPSDLTNPTVDTSEVIDPSSK